MPAPAPSPGLTFERGYHASPQLSLTSLDPSFSRGNLRYGPRVYLYLEAPTAEAHARSINLGQIKKDRHPHPALIYEGWVDTTPLSNAHNPQFDTSAKSDHLKRVNEAFLRAGYRTIKGSIHDPDTGEEHSAYISLVPVDLSP